MLKVTVIFPKIWWISCSKQWNLIVLNHNWPCCFTAYWKMRIVMWRFNKNTNICLGCKLCKGGGEGKTKQDCFCATQNLGILLLTPKGLCAAWQEPLRTHVTGEEEQPELTGYGDHACGQERSWAVLQQGHHINSSTPSHTLHLNLSVKEEDA